MIRVLLLCLLGLPVLAATPADYAYQWSLELVPGASAHRVALTPALYAQVSDPGLRDLEVFNAAGESVPFGPIAAQADPPPPPALEPVPWFLMPDRQARAAVSQSLTLRIKRDALGRLRALDAGAADAAGQERVSSVLIDLDPAPGAVQWLEVQWEREADVSARYQIAASHDLMRWRTLSEGVGLVDLRQGDFELHRNRIDLPPHTERYLLLTRIDGGIALAITEVRAAARPLSEFSASLLQWVELDADPVVGEEGVYRYQAPGPLPVTQASVRLASPDSVVEVQLASRDDSEQGWRPRTRFTAFRVGEPGGEEVTNEAQQIRPGRDRQWQVRTGPGLDQPPRLRLGYRPDEFALLARGQGPFVLAVGSARAQRPDYPVAALLVELRARRGLEWRLADAGIGSVETTGGAVAYTVERTLPWRQWLLWGVLVMGALLVVGMVLRLARG
jgi:hypothetical protein